MGMTVLFEKWERKQLLVIHGFVIRAFYIQITNKINGFAREKL